MAQEKIIVENDSGCTCKNNISVENASSSKSKDDSTVENDSGSTIKNDSTVENDGSSTTENEQEPLLILDPVTALIFADIFGIWSFCSFSIL